jgi:hypothetical protein
MNINAEACGLRIVPDQRVDSPNVGVEPLPDTKGRPEFVIISPDFKVSEGPRIGQAASGAEAPGEGQYFQSELQFQLKDPSGRVPSRIEILCRRPHFVVNEELVNFALGAVEYGLKVQPLQPLP